MVKRKDRTARRQILQLKEEKSHTRPHPIKNVPSGPAVPSLTQEENDDSDGAEETTMSNEPASKNGVERDAIDDQLADFMKEIDAISTPVPGMEDPENNEQKSEPDEKEPTATSSGSAPVSEAASQEADSQKLVSAGAAVADVPPPPAEGEVPRCPWVECIDEATGYTYFWHQVTNEVTWDCPPEYEAYWAQYGEPVEGSAVDHNAGVASHTATPDTAAAAVVAAAAEPTPSPALNSTAASSSKVVPSGTAFIDTEAASAVETKTAKPARAEQPSTSMGACGTSKPATTARKKRKQETVIGAIIPITSYGASDSSSSEDSDRESYVVQRTSSRKPAAKRLKASLSTKQSQGGLLPPVVYGPQLPDSSLLQPEQPVYGPLLPAALDTIEAVVYGPHLPIPAGSPEERVYGPHLPDSVGLESEPEPPVVIASQLLESHEALREAATSSSVFIGPQLPEGFLEKKGEPSDEEKPAVCETPPSLEPVGCSQEPMEVDEHKAEPETAVANGPQDAATTQESKSPPPVVKGESVAPKGSEPVVAGSASALGGLVDYPGSPIADSEDDDEMDVREEDVVVPASGSDQASTNYPVMTGGKLQFENTGQGASNVDVPKDAALSSSGAKESTVASLAPASSPATLRPSKAKHSAQTKKKSQHLVSYGDSESSDEDSVDVDITAESPAASTNERSDPTSAVASEMEEEGRHPGLGSSRKASSEEREESAVKPSSKKTPFVKVNFVRSAEVLVLSECVDVGAELKSETEKETEKEEEKVEEMGRVSPGSDRTAGTKEGSASPAEHKPSEESDMDDLDDVVRALDIALLESQKKKAQRDVAKLEASPKKEREQSSCDTSEEEGEIKSSEVSSEEEMSPTQYRKSDTKEEPEAMEDDVPKRKRASSRRTPSPRPDRKAAEMRVKIGDAYKLLMDKLNPLRDVVACRNTYFELVIQTMTRMEDWRAGVLEAGYFLQKLHAACDAAAQLQLVAQAQEDASPIQEESSQGPLPPGWQRHWDSGHSRYFYVQEETGHAQWTFPTAGTTTSGSPDLTAQTAAQGISGSGSSATAHSLPAPPPPPAQEAGSTSETSPETTGTKREEGGAEGSNKQDDSASLDAAEAAFYSSVALSAEPVITTAPQADCNDKLPASTDPAPTDEATVPAAPAPKKKKTKVTAGLTLRKKNIPTLLQKWEKIKEEQKRGMPS